MVLEKEGASYTIVTSGSEVQHCVAIAQELGLRVVSVPSLSLFKAQSSEYRKSVLKTDRDHTISVEPYIALGWESIAANHIGV